MGSLCKTYRNNKSAGSGLSGEAVKPQRVAGLRRVAFVEVDPGTFSENSVKRESIPFMAIYGMGCSLVQCSGETRSASRLGGLMFGKLR